MNQTIDRIELDALKASVDLVALFEHYGLPLKKVGKNHFCRCFLHEEDEASLSVNPADRLWQCFGCKKGGDALTFLQLREKLEFPQALEALRQFAGTSTPSPAVNRAELMERLAQLYHQRFWECPEPQSYLNVRGLTERDVWQAFRIGYCDGSVASKLPTEGPTFDALRQLGILNEEGKEHFRGCLVVPLTHPNQGVVGFYGRRLSPESKTRHLYLPGPKRGVLNWPAFKASSTLYLCESVLDSLSLWQAGAAQQEDKARHESFSQGFLLELGEVRYEIRMLPPFSSRLRVRLRGFRGESEFLDKIDLYIQRARVTAAAQIAKALQLQRFEAEQHLKLILEKAEDWVQNQHTHSESAPSAKAKKLEMSGEERAEALRFLQAPNLVECILEDMEELGFVGEEHGKLIAYFVGISRKLPKPLSASVISQSSVGKSSLTSMIEFLTPDDEVLHFTRLTSQALYYFPTALSHMLLIWTILKESKILEESELSRSCYYEAKRGLIEKSIIQVKKTPTGTCCYRLRGNFQPLLDDAESLTEAQNAPPSPGSRTPTNKENKENYNKHHQPRIPVGDKAANDDDFLSDFLNERAQVIEVEAQSPKPELSPPNEPADEQSWKKVPPPSRPARAKTENLTPEQAALVGQIRRLGVSGHVAARLVTQKPAELIQRVLDGLATRPDLRNPAGWFVQEVMAGGYLAPKAQQADELRQKAASSRFTEREMEQRQREATNAQALAEWSEVQRLEPQLLGELVQSARAQLARFSPLMATAADDAPMMRAAVLELYRASAKTAAYLPRGESAWAERRRQVPGTDEVPTSATWRDKDSNQGEMDG